MAKKAATWGAKTLVPLCRAAASLGRPGGGRPRSLAAEASESADLSSALSLVLGDTSAALRPLSTPYGWAAHGGASPTPESLGPSSDTPLPPPPPTGAFGKGAPGGHRVQGFAGSHSPLRAVGPARSRGDGHICLMQPCWSVSLRSGQSATFWDAVTRPRPGSCGRPGLRPPSSGLGLALPALPRPGQTAPGRRPPRFKRISFALKNSSPCLSEFFHSGVLQGIYLS